MTKTIITTLTLLTLTQFAQGASVKSECSMMGGEGTLTIETLNVEGDPNLKLMKLSLHAKPWDFNDFPNPENKSAKMGGFAVVDSSLDPLSEIFSADGMLTLNANSELIVEPLTIQIHGQLSSKGEGWINFMDSKRIFHGGFGNLLNCKAVAQADLKLQPL